MLNTHREVNERQDETDIQNEESASPEPMMNETGNTEDEPETLKRMDIRYMHRPPRIVPNYGKKTRSILPKSNVPRVLLYDNVTQQQMLDVKLSNIRSENQKTIRILDLHKKAFLFRRMIKHQRAQDTKTVTNTVLDLLLPMILGDDGGASGRPTMVHSSGASGRPTMVHSSGASGRPTMVHSSGASGRPTMVHSSGTSGRPTMVHSSDGEYPTRKESVKLPSIEDSSVRVGFKEYVSDGFTRMMHTMKSPCPTGCGTRSANAGLTGRRADSGRRRSRRRTVLDKRFQGLEERLFRLEYPGNGYIGLSPSYHRETPLKVPTGLVSVRVAHTSDSNTVHR